MDFQETRIQIGFGIPENFDTSHTRVASRSTLRTLPSLNNVCNE